MLLSALAWGERREAPPATPAVASSAAIELALVPSPADAAAVPGQTSSIAALDVIGADRWRAAGFTGQGVRVAIVDTGFAGYTARLGVSLPERVVARSFRADGRIDGGSEHGTFAARIVSAVAPRAELHLLSFGTVAELAQVVEYLVTQRIDVVSFSLGFVHNGPGNGTGPLNAVVSRSLEGGALWAVAAGNWAQQHWVGPYRDRDGDGVHEFANGLEENGRLYRAGDLITVSLRWDEPFGAACTDFDIELFGAAGELVRASRLTQACQDDPVESLQVLATRDGRYSVRIIEATAMPGPSGPPARRLELLMLGSPDRGEGLEVAVPAGSLAEPADHPRVLSVGAISAAGAGGGAPTVARFSSRGPSADGRVKPDLVAPTGRFLPGGEVTFSGTSAAAPHVAGMLALMREAWPAAPGAELLRELRARALDLGPAGLDADSGAGLAQLGSLEGLGPLLPAGAATAALAGPLPQGEGLTAMRYRGPSGYPLRFVHLLPLERRVIAVYRLELLTARFDQYIVGAPTFVQTFDTLRDGDLLFMVVAAP